MLKDQIVLITGGTGSFGAQMVECLLARGCGEIRIFSRDESKQDLMREAYQNPALQFFIGDVRDSQSLREAMQGADLVFHAAALKQVPSCEFFPLEALRTNVLGSENVLNAAIEHGVRSVVCLSTDKAVYPINAMGMTKALMEKVSQAAARKLNHGRTVISCVRYGNVIQSRGSVIPRFIKQIMEGRPLTLTDPRMTRFLLSLKDAIDLVEFAFENANPGDLFIRKAPACSLETLVQALQSTFPIEVKVDVIGRRHGEKRFETLASLEELARSEDMGSYYRIRMDNRDLNYAKYLSEGHLKENQLEDFNSENAPQLSQKEVETILLDQPEIQAAIKTVIGNSA